MKLVVGLVPLVLAALLPAQGYVSPTHFRTSEGTSGNTLPFGSLIALHRYVQVHDDVPPTSIRALAFRHDAGVIAVAHGVRLDAWVSTAATTSATANATFDLNHGPDKLHVIANRWINVGASDPAQLPGPWVLQFPFDVPFVFAGGGSLCWEVQVTGRLLNASVAYDSCLGPDPNPQAQASRVHDGCTSTGASGPMALAALGFGRMDWPTGTGTLNMTATNAQANGLVLFVTGTNRTSWAGVPLPFDVPGSTGAPSGTCRIHNDALLIRPAMANVFGDVANPLTFAVNPALNGLTVYTQAWGIDAAANPFGITTSNQLLHNLVAPYAALPVSRVYLTGALGPVGTVNANSSALPTCFLP